MSPTRITPSADNSPQPGKVKTPQPKQTPDAQPKAAPAPVLPAQVVDYVSRCFKNEKKRIASEIDAAVKREEINWETATVAKRIILGPPDDLWLEWQ
jgi:hypothetical protein